MNLKKFLEINEGIGERTLNHFTDADALEGILKNEKLSTSEYLCQTSKGKREFCTVRPSMSNKSNVDRLSNATSGGVKIIIDGSKLSDTVRGVKIKPMAEFYNIWVRMAKKILDTKQTQTVNRVEKDLDKFIKTKDKMERAKQKTIIMKRYTLPDHYFGVILDEYERYLKNKNKEGEERIVVNKETKFIPLDKKYVKIEIVNPRRVFKESDKANLLTLIKRKKHFFVYDDKFKELLRLLEGYKIVFNG